jgi:hypothetical protein
MSGKPTPGEWLIMDRGAWPMIYGPSGERVCKVIDNPADAPILAAALELRDALAAIVEELAEDGTTELTMPSLAEAKAALAKARDKGKVRA